MPQKRKLVLGTGLGLGKIIPQPDQIHSFAAAGFDGVFIEWMSREETFACAEIAAKCGLTLTFVHAPFGMMTKLWEGDRAERREAVDALKASITDTADAGVQLAVLHAVIGMEKHTPTPDGLPYFGELAGFARAKGVRLAFENTEGPEYLDAVMEYLAHDDNVGYCFDSGHELCYNHAGDMLARHGDRLFVTHLNDNRGQTGEEITFYDDNHLLPFDGIADWTGIADRLLAHRFGGDLTFELMKTPRKGREDVYGALSLEAYLAEAYRRAVKFRTLLEEREKP